MRYAQYSIRDTDLEFLSTTVEKPLQIDLFMQNKPNFMRFSPENEDLTKKRTQFPKHKNESFFAECELYNSI